MNLFVIMDSLTYKNGKILVFLYILLPLIESNPAGLLAYGCVYLLHTCVESGVHVGWSVWRKVLQRTLDAHTRTPTKTCLKNVWEAQSFKKPARLLLFSPHACCILSPEDFPSNFICIHSLKLCEMFIYDAVLSFSVSCLYIGEMPSILPRSLVQNGWSSRFTACKNRLNQKGRKSGAHMHLYSQDRWWDFAYTKTHQGWTRWMGLITVSQLRMCGPLRFTLFFTLEAIFYNSLISSSVISI